MSGDAGYRGCVDGLSGRCGDEKSRWDGRTRNGCHSSTRTLEGEAQVGSRVLDVVNLGHLLNELVALSHFVLLGTDTSSRAGNETGKREDAQQSRILHVPSLFSERKTIKPLGLIEDGT